MKQASLEKKYTYTLSNSDLQIEIFPKKIRSLRIRIDRNANVFCSVPFFSSSARIAEFIESKREWILKSVEKVKISLLNGEKLEKNSAAFLLGLGEEDYLGKRSGERLYSKRWKALAAEFFTHSLENQYDYFRKCELSKRMPELENITLKFRKLKSMWGNCNRRTNAITLNYELLRFPQKCIDYVVLHELTHFLYIYHDKNFYKTIERFMPDYKNVIKLMK